MPQPLIELGGASDAPVMHIALANGFAPETYLPLLEPFFQAYRVVCLPPRALWGDGPPPPVSEPGDWRDVAADLLAGLEQHGLDDVVALGHSFGGIASMLAALELPRRFRALILLDPTILTPDILSMMKQGRAAGLTDQHPLVRAALRRTRHFDSVQQAYERFKGRRLFQDWPERTVRLYAEAGTEPDPAGGVRLRWSPEWEAYYYATGYADTWDILPRLDGVLPTLFLQGAESDTYITESFERVKSLLPGATHIQISGHGHLFPHSAPQHTAQIIQDWLNDRQIAHETP